MDLRKIYQEETGYPAVLECKHTTTATFNYVEWLEKKIIQNEKDTIKEEKIYHALNCNDCNLEGQFVFAKDGSDEDWSLVELREIKSRTNYPFHCVGKRISGPFQFIKKATNVKEITRKEAVDILASYGHYVEITCS
jgi:hypothetical protein